MTFKRSISLVVLLGTFMFLALPVFAGEADIKLPPLDKVQFSAFGGMSGLSIMYFGLLVCVVGLIFAMVQYSQTSKLPAHKSMLDVSNIIWETCKSLPRPAGKIPYRPLGTHCHMYDLLFHGIVPHAVRRNGDDPLRLDPRNTGFIRCGLVRYEDQY